MGPWGNMGPGLGTPMDLSGEKLAFALEDETQWAFFLIDSKFTGRVELECRMIFYSPGLLYHFFGGGREDKATFFVNSSLVTGR